MNCVFPSPHSTGSNKISRGRRGERLFLRLTNAPPRAGGGEEVKP